jgi:hypothetical protein
MRDFSRLELFCSSVNGRLRYPFFVYFQLDILIFLANLFVEFFADIGAVSIKFLILLFHKTDYLTAVMTTSKSKKRIFLPRSGGAGKDFFGKITGRGSGVR